MLSEEAEKRATAIASEICDRLGTPFMADDWIADMIAPALLTAATEAREAALREAEEIAKDHVGDRLAGDAMASDIVAAIAARCEASTTGGDAGERE